MQTVTLSEESQVILTRMRAIVRKMEAQGIHRARGIWWRRKPGRNVPSCACPISMLGYNYEGLDILYRRGGKIQGRRLRKLACDLLEVPMEFVWGLMAGNDDDVRAYRQPYTTVRPEQAYWQGVAVGIALNRED